MGSPINVFTQQLLESFEQGRSQAESRKRQQLIEQQLGQQERLNPLQEEAQRLRNEILASRPDLINAQAQRDLGLAAKRQAQALFIPIDPDISDEELKGFTGPIRTLIRQSRKRGETAQIPIALFQREIGSQGQIGAATVRSSGLEELRLAIAEAQRAKATGVPQQMSIAFERARTARDRLNAELDGLLGPFETRTVSEEEFTETGGVKRTTTRTPIRPPRPAAQAQPGGIQVGPVDLSQLQPAGLSRIDAFIEAAEAALQSGQLTESQLKRQLDNAPSLSSEEKQEIREMLFGLEGSLKRRRRKVLR